MDKGLFAKSDDLASLKALEERYHSGGNLLRLPERIPFVIDTNKVLGDLLWMSTRREKLDARTDLLEVADAGIATIYAPKKLKAEVERHLPKLAKERRIPVDALKASWSLYQRRIIFVPVRVRKNMACRDPEDLAFIATAIKIQAAGVITRDKDIKAMGGQPIPAGLLRKLRDYARSKAFEVKTQATGAFILVVLITLFAISLRMLVRGGRRIGWPPIIAVGIAIAAVVAASESASGKNRQLLSKIWNEMREAMLALNKPLGDFVAQYCDEKEKAETLWKEVGEELALGTSSVPYSGDKAIPDAP